MNGRLWGRGAGLLIATLMVLGACDSANGGSVLPAPAKTKDPLAGDYVASGANGANPQMTALTKAFTALHPGVNFKLNDVDTETSVVNVSTGDVDFGYIGRELRSAELGKVVLTGIGFTGSSLAVNVANPITNLTKDQVRRIFTGQITDWSQVSSTAGPVKVFRREAASSTRTTVESYVYGSDPPTYGPDVVEIFESTDLIKAVGAFKGALGTVTLSGKNLKDTSMKLIGMDGVQPTLDNLNNGSWKLSKQSYITTSADPAKVKPAIKALLAFIKSPDGQKIVAGQ